MLTALTRRCTTCSELLPDPPAPPVCPRCGRVACPRHEEWPKHLQWWLLRELGGRRCLPWYSTQTWFDGLLRDAMVGGTAPSRPNPRDTRLTTSTPLIELYPKAIALATQWRAAGSPILPDRLLQTGAGVTQGPTT